MNFEESEVPRTVYAIYAPLQQDIYEMQAEWHATLDEALKVATPGCCIGTVFDPERFSSLYQYPVTKRVAWDGTVEEVADLWMVPNERKTYTLQVGRFVSLKHDEGDSN